MMVPRLAVFLVHELRGHAEVQQRAYRMFHISSTCFLGFMLSAAFAALQCRVSRAGRSRYGPAYPFNPTPCPMPSRLVCPDICHHNTKLDARKQDLLRRKPSREAVAEACNAIASLLLFPSSLLRTLSVHLNTAICISGVVLLVCLRVWPNSCPDRDDEDTGRVAVLPEARSCPPTSKHSSTTLHSFPCMTAFIRRARANR